MLLEEGIPAPTSEAAPPPPVTLTRVARLRALAAARRPRTRLLVNLITVAVTLGFSYIALSHIRPSEVWHALRTSDYWWLVPAFAVFVLSNVARALRWRSLFAPAGGRRSGP